MHCLQKKSDSSLSKCFPVCFQVFHARSKINQIFLAFCFAISHQRLQNAKRTRLQQTFESALVCASTKVAVAKHRLTSMTHMSNTHATQLTGQNKAEITQHSLTNIVICLFVRFVLQMLSPAASSACRQVLHTKTQLTIEVVIVHSGWEPTAAGSGVLSKDDLDEMMLDAMTARPTGCSRDVLRLNHHAQLS